MTGQEILLEMRCVTGYKGALNIEGLFRMSKEAIGIIKHQQAEIERLKAIEAMEEKQHHYCKDVCYPNHKAEIERLTEEKDNLIRTYKECMVSVLADFAKRLKEKSYIPNPYWKTSVVDEYIIDNLVKEMTEETK